MATIPGSVYDDIIFGTAAGELLSGGSGKDEIHAGAGDDQVSGGSGNDLMMGDAGNDTLEGGSGNDLQFGGDGNDALLGGSGKDTMFGDAGNDSLDGGSDDDKLFGGDGLDTLRGGAGNDQLFGDAGDDLVDGGTGNDTLFGGDGQDQLVGGIGNDALFAGSGNDQLFGGIGDDTLYGDAGNDTLDGGIGNDKLFGGDGYDKVYGGTGDDVLDGGKGDDLVDGGDGDDVLTLHDYFAICANDGLMTYAGSGRLCREATPDACHACLPDIGQHRFVARTLHLQTVLHQVDRFIAPSAFLRDRYVDWGLPAEKIEIVTNGLPTAEPAPAARRVRRTFGFFGNIAPHKGVLLMLDAIERLAREHDDIRLHVHGGLNFQRAPFRQAFDQAVAAAQPAARIFGPYRRSELPQLMAELDWVVVPSIWWENAPLVVLEAFQHRRPVICSDIGGMAEMVRDGSTGLHFRAGDAADLARVMHRAVRQRGLWRRLADGLSAPRSLAETTDRHLALYHTLLRHEEALSA